MPLPKPAELIAQMADARARTLALVEGLDAGQLMGPKLAIVNPLRWEILYDSITIAHDDRWDLPLPPLPDTLAYMRQAQERVCAHLANDPPDARRDYLAQYAVFHEDMHTEAFTYTRQTLGYPTPAIGVARDPAWTAGGLEGNAAIPGGELVLGAQPDGGFCFDNEKWAHRVEVRPFRIARAAVSNAQYSVIGDASSGTRRG